jgi:predicted outer membrane protein
MVQGNDNNSGMRDQKSLSSKAQEWFYRLAKDPKQYEKETFVDSINTMKQLIKELEKIRKTTPATDHFLHADIVRARKQLNETLSRIQERYEIFKRYKKKNSISK